MTDKELRRLSREELLKLLLEQTKENERLREELSKKKAGPAPVAGGADFAQTTQKTADVLCEAQKVAAEHIEAVRRICAQQEQAAQEMLCAAREKCRLMEEETKARCEETLRNAKEEAEKNWRDMAEKIEQLSRSSEEMRTLLSSEGKKRRRG